MSDPLGDGPEGRSGADCLQLLVISDQNQLRPARLDLGHKPGELPAAQHAGLVDHEHVPEADLLASPTSWVLPSVLPGRERPTADAGGFLETLGRLAGQGRAMNRKPLGLPGLPGRPQHRRLAGARKPDHGRDPRLARDVLHGMALLVR